MLKEAFTCEKFYTEKPFPEGSCCLSMFISRYSLQYAVSVNNFKQVAELCHIDFTVAANTGEELMDQVALIVRNYGLDQKKFEKVNIAVLTQEFNLLPETYALETDSSAVLSFTTGSQQLKSPLTHRLNGIQLSYRHDQHLHGYLERTFVNATIRHAAAVEISLLFGMGTLSDCSLWLNLNSGCMEIIIRENNSLRFYNCFACASNEDILYYLLFTMEQFGIDPLKVKLFISGQAPVNGDLVNSIKRYIRTVSFCVHDPSVTLDGDLAQMPLHYYFVLLNQHTCVL